MHVRPSSGRPLTSRASLITTRRRRALLLSAGAAGVVGVGLLALLGWGSAAAPAGGNVRDPAPASPPERRTEPALYGAARPRPALEPPPPDAPPVARPLRQELDGPLAASRALWLLGEEDSVAASAAAGRLRDLLEPRGVMPDDVSIVCRALACRVALEFPSLPAMAELEHLRDEELDGRFVVGRPERAGAEAPWVVVAYEFFDEDSVPLPGD